MNTLTLAGDYSSAFTFVQNDFIDYYMRDINESQIKIYLYLLRSKGANLQVSVSSIADFFNDSEKDVIRALKYLDKQKLIALEYDNDKEPSGIRLLNAEESRKALDIEAMDTTGQSGKTKPVKRKYGADELLSFRERSDIASNVTKADVELVLGKKLEGFKTENVTRDVVVIVLPYRNTAMVEIPWILVELPEGH